MALYAALAFAFAGVVLLLQSGGDMQTFKLLLGSVGLQQVLAVFAISSFQVVMVVGLGHAIMDEQFRLRLGITLSQSLLLRLVLSMALTLFIVTSPLEILCVLAGLAVPYLIRQYLSSRSRSKVFRSYARCRSRLRSDRNTTRAYGAAIDVLPGPVVYGGLWWLATEYSDFNPGVVLIASFLLTLAAVNSFARGFRRGTYIRTVLEAVARRDNRRLEALNPSLANYLIPFAFLLTSWAGSSLPEEEFVLGDGGTLVGVPLADSGAWVTILAEDGGVHIVLADSIESRRMCPGSANPSLLRIHADVSARGAC